MDFCIELKCLLTLANFSSLVQRLLVGPSIAHKHWTRLEKLAVDKHFGLLQKSVNFGPNKLYSEGPK
jgi:hypothetical protein